MRRFGVLALVIAVAGCATSPAERAGMQAGPGQEVQFGATPAFLGMMGRADGEELQRRIVTAAASALGSRENPIRVNLPQGQHAYLRRLRCSTGAAPEFTRGGNVGPGPFGSIVDRYEVRCPAGEPREATVYLDMYHPEHDEALAPPGFTLFRGRAADRPN